MDIDNITMLLLAINALLLAINSWNHSRRIRNLENQVYYLTLKEFIDYEENKDRK
jgi:hypothetical protein